MKKKNIMMIVGVATVVLAFILLVSGVILSLKGGYQYKKFNHFETAKCMSKVCKFNKNTLEIKENGDKNTVLLNGKQVFEAFENIPLSKDIYTFDDTLVLSVDLPSYNNYKLLELINPSGNEYTEKVISELEPGMLISDFKVDDGKITFTGLSFIEKDTALFGNTIDDVVKIDSCEKYTENMDKIVSGKYIMTYLDNNKFSDIRRIEDVKLENYKDYSKLCDEN